MFIYFPWYYSKIALRIYDSSSRILYCAVLYLLGVLNLEGEKALHRIANDLEVIGDHYARHDDHVILFM